MAPSGSTPARGAVVRLDPAVARAIWLHAQRLDRADPFGSGPEAVLAAVRHLGYVQIDSINVIERAHHHVLWTRIPHYRPADLASAQSVDRSVFEAVTHALSYVPSSDFRYFLPDMLRHRWRARSTYHGSVTDEDVHRVLDMLGERGPLRIRDITDDVLIDKTHLWGSRKPSKHALDVAERWGLVTASGRVGIEKTYDLTARHFGWEQEPEPATAQEVTAYRLDRALRAQGVVSLDSTCHLAAPAKPAVRALVEARVAAGELVEVRLEGSDIPHWARPETLDDVPGATVPRVHVLSPFDPLVIQRKRLELFFGYAHRFEAYLPRAKRVHGYFALPVLVGDRIVAVVDLKTDRRAGRVLVQQWTWLDEGGAVDHRGLVEEALARFETLQVAG